MKNNPSSQTLYLKLERYCAYQDRCTRDVELKLKGLKVTELEMGKVIEQLKEEQMIDDQRFANAFVRGKFSVNKWGRNRITNGLRIRQLPESIISMALREIDEESYLEAIRTLIIKKSREINPEKTLNKREKIINFVVGKGYESDLVLRMIQEIKL